MEEEILSSTNIYYCIQNSFLLYSEFIPTVLQIHSYRRMIVV